MKTNAEPTPRDLLAVPFLLVTALLRLLTLPFIYLTVMIGGRWSLEQVAVMLRWKDED